MDDIRRFSALSGQSNGQVDMCCVFGNVCCSYKMLWCCISQSHWLYRHYGHLIKGDELMIKWNHCYGCWLEMCREPILILSTCAGRQTSGPTKCHLSAVAIYDFLWRDKLTTIIHILQDFEWIATIFESIWYLLGSQRIACKRYGLMEEDSGK